METAVKRLAAMLVLAVGLSGSALALAEDGGGGEAAHHISYTGDEDHDGVPNWRDPANGDHKNEAYVVPSVLQHAFNLALLLAIAAYAARRPISDAVANRAGTIRQELVDAAALRDEARAEHEAVAKRLQDFQEEVVRMKAQAEEHAAQEAAQLLARAQEASVRIKESAERNIREEVMRAKVALHKEAVDLAVQLAEQTLTAQVGADDQRRLAREFLQSLNEDAHGRQ